MAVALFNRQLPAVPRALMEKYGNVIGFCSETAKSLIQQSANRNPARAMLNNICSVNAGNNPQFNKPTIRCCACSVQNCLAISVEKY